MTGTGEQNPGDRSGTLSGAEKVAVLLLAMDKQKAASLLRHFNPDEVRQLTRSTQSLRPIASEELEVIVDEFTRRFETGMKFVGSYQEVESLLSEVMERDELAKVINGEPEKIEESVWVKLSSMPLDAVKNLLTMEHPQTAAFMLSRLDGSMVARILAGFPGEGRNALLLRMLALSRIPAESTVAVEEGLRQKLRIDPSEADGAGRSAFAGILNKLERSQTDEVIRLLSTTRPKEAKALKRLLFSFEDLVKLDVRGRGMLFDKVGTETLVLALKGTDQQFQGIVLASLASRSRRMVEAELQSATTTSPADTIAARRTIADMVLNLAQAGELTLPDAGPDEPE